MTGSNERIVAPIVTTLSIPGDFKHYVLLDRDGVINIERGDYTTTLDEWEWAPGALDGLKLLTEQSIGGILITNQACIAKGIQTETGLASLHKYMLDTINDAGGGLAAIYHCPHQTPDECGCRKPEPGMIFRAAEDYGFSLPDTWFIGDTARDMQAAKNAGAHGILLINSWNAWPPKDTSNADIITESLYDAAEFVIRELE